MKELKLDATAEDVIDKAWLVNESIKAIAKEMIPGTRSELLQDAMSYQNYKNITPQGQKYGCATDTSTPAKVVKQNCKLKSTEVNNTVYKVSKLVPEDNIKVAKEGSNVQSSKLQNTKVNNTIDKVPKGVTEVTSRFTMSASMFRARS